MNKYNLALILLNAIMAIAVISVLYFNKAPTVKLSDEDAYENCRSKFTKETDCFNRQSVTECLSAIEKTCGKN